MTEKTAILENQIVSLKEIVQIQERQLNTTLNSPEELLTGWRTKVYELLVKNNFLLKQNKEFENNQAQLRKDRDGQVKKIASELTQKEAEIRQLKNKIDVLKIEKEDLWQKNEHLSGQNSLLREEGSSIRTHFSDLVKIIEDRFTKEMVKVSLFIRDNVASRFSELANKTANIQNSTALLKRLYGSIFQRIIQVSNENQGFKASLAQIIEDLLNSENNQVKIKIPREKDEIIRLTKAICDNNKNLTRKLQDSQANFDRLQTELRENSSQAQTYSHRLANLTTASNEKESQIKDLNEKVKVLEKSLLDQNTQRMTLQSQISNLNVEKSYKEQEIEALKKHIQEFELKRGEAQVYQEGIVAQLKQAEERRSREIEGLNARIQDLEFSKKDQIQKLMASHEEKLKELERAKSDIVQSLKSEVEDLNESRAREAQNIADLESSLQDHKEKTASFSNQINDLLKIIEIKDKNLEKFRNQQSGATQSFRNSTIKESGIKNNLLSSLQTPQTKLQRDANRSKSPFLFNTERPGVISRIENRGIGTEKSFNNQSTLISRIEAAEKMASDILDDI